MLFNSVDFLLFYVATAALYYALAPTRSLARVLPATR